MCLEAGERGLFESMYARRRTTIPSFSAGGTCLSKGQLSHPWPTLKQTKHTHAAVGSRCSGRANTAVESPSQGYSSSAITGRFKTGKLGGSRRAGILLGGGNEDFVPHSRSSARYIRILNGLWSSSSSEGWLAANKDRTGSLRPCAKSDLISDVDSRDPRADASSCNRSPN
jgi:hypothetical protein